MGQICCVRDHLRYLGHLTAARVICIQKPRQKAFVMFRNVQCAYSQHILNQIVTILLLWHGAIYGTHRAHRFPLLT